MLRRAGPSAARAPCPDQPSSARPQVREDLTREGAPEKHKYWYSSAKQLAQAMETFYTPLTGQEWSGASSDTKAEL